MDSPANNASATSAKLVNGSGAACSRFPGPRKGFPQRLSSPLEWLFVASPQRLSEFGRLAAR